MKLNKGDVFKILSTKRNVYIQYILKDETMGQLIRVFAPDVKSVSGPRDIKERKELFYVFFPLGSALRRKLVVKIGSSDLPGGQQLPKFMKAPFGINAAGKITSWSIFELDTGKQKVVEKLSKQEIRYSPYECWNDTQIIEAVNANWSPAKLEEYL